MNEEQKQALETFKHWIEYEKNNKEKINKADELISMQECILGIIDKQQKEIKARLEEIDSLYKMMSVKDDEIEYLEQKLEQMGLDYQILKDDMEEHNVVYVDTPEFEEKYISKDKIKEKLNSIDKEYAETIEKNKNDLYLVNINAHRHSAMQSILEELLGE